ncbi:MAG: hypothetical protein JXA49_07460 [Actinobacteria bacterium]|nr:hypothetical protein [Actinomycetota bacterium]
MPELPEVEIKRRYLEKTSLGKSIKNVQAIDGRILDSVSPVSLGRSLKGRKLLKARRRGKYILLTTSDNNTLLMHFGMSGDAVFTGKGEPRPKWTRVIFHFENGSALNYTSMRLLGKIAFYKTANESEIPDISKLGPEPLETSMGFDKFNEMITGHSTTIHQILMRQELVAGIGNLYSDEITYQAGVLPYRKTGNLLEVEIRSLFDKMKWVLKTAVKLDADLEDKADLFLIPNRKKDGTCPRGHGKLSKRTIGGRTSYYCTTCQQ